MTPQELILLLESKCECWRFEDRPGFLTLLCRRCIQLREHEAEILSALRMYQSTLTYQMAAKPLHLICAEQQVEIASLKAAHEALANATITEAGEEEVGDRALKELARLNLELASLKAENDRLRVELQHSDERLGEALVSVKGAEYGEGIAMADLAELKAANSSLMEELQREICSERCGGMWHVQRCHELTTELRKSSESLERKE